MSMKLSCKKKIKIAYSSDSDDAFMFMALENEKVAWRDYSFSFYRADIQELNEKAAQGEFEVSAVSVAAWPHISTRYHMLGVGASVADKAGPIMITTRETLPADLAGCRIAFPGAWTTAFLATKSLWPDIVPIHMHFLQIMPAVLDGKVDAGVLIHELQLGYESYPVRKVLDLGMAWRKKNDHPLPLGVNVIRKDLSAEDAHRITHTIRASITYGLSHRAETLQAANAKAVTSIDPALSDDYIKRYVNATTLHLSPAAKQGIDLLLQVPVSYVD